MAESTTNNVLPAALRAPVDWPQPDSEAQKLSCELVRRLRQEMQQHAGRLSFSRYMEMALYAPGLGYYSAGLAKFGASGDFVTAPEISPLFSRCVARFCKAVLEQLGTGDILELGAGSGVMAADVLLELSELGQLPEQYFILERSAELRQRQRSLLEDRVPDLCSRVEWLDQPPQQKFQGVMLANEVLDALPVHRFQLQDHLMREQKVVWQNDAMEWQFVPIPRPNTAPITESRLAAALSDLLAKFDLQDGYTSEINLDLAPWLETVTASLSRGAALFIDYGYSAAEYYHPQRDAGTLMCHYRHRAHDNPLILPGLQDITCHVDFTAVAEAGHVLDLELLGYTSQAHFLLDSGLQEIFAATQAESEVQQLKMAQQVKTLTLPGEMGERFKCMALGRGVEQPLPGFRGHQLRRTL